MKVCTCLLLLRIFGLTNSISLIDKRSGATKNLHNENNYKPKINDKNKNLKLVFRAPKVESFIDFIQETFGILNIFEDDAFKEFFLIFDNEIRNYHYKGCKFSELTENRDTRHLLTRTLKTIRWKPVTFTKAKIYELADTLRNEKYDNNVKELLYYINGLYKNSKKIFHRFVTNLNLYRKLRSIKTHEDFVQIIRDGVRSIFFNHYSELDANSRRELIKRIEKFWKKFKKIPNSNAQINNVETDPVREPRIKRKSFEESNNVMNEAKEPDHSKDQEVEDDLSSSESGDQDTAEELSSRQTFDSSSTSIKLSQERQEEYNTQRYMTLYTEEISYKAGTTKESEIMPMSNNVTTKQHKDQRRQTTTPKYRPRDVMKKKMLRTNQEMGDQKRYIDPNLDQDSDEPRVLPLVRASQSAHRREPHKPDKSRSKSRHENAHVVSQYDAVIDVRLDNPDLLESLRMFAPAEMATNSSHDTSPYPRSAAHRRTKTDLRPQSPTAPTKYPLRHSISFKSHHLKPVNDSRRRISPSPLIKGPVERHKKNKTTITKSPARRSANDTKDFNEYVMKKIDALENEIKELKQMNIVRMEHENNTKEIQVSNFTAERKHMKDTDIERLSKTSQNLDDKIVIKESGPEYNANSKETNTNSSTTNNNLSANVDTVNNDIVSATIIESKTTTKALENGTNITSTKTDELSKEAATDTITSSDRTSDVMDTATVESDDTTPASDDSTPASSDTTPASGDTTPASGDTTPATDVPRRTMAYSQPMYNDYLGGRLDPFDHIQDGLDLNM